MKSFRVFWEIELEANTAKEAAERALEIQRDPESIATAFRVMDNRPNTSYWIVPKDIHTGLDVQGFCNQVEVDLMDDADE
jgi:hypothetical protein